MASAKGIESKSQLESENIELTLVHQNKKAHVKEKIYITRLVTKADIPALRKLEVEKWGVNGFTNENLESIIKLAPEYSWGYFDQSSGKALGSCFVMGKSKEKIINSKDWFETTDNGNATSHNKKSKTWFGMSLSSSHDDAVLAILVDVLTKVLKDGIKEVYLGAPISGFHKWSEKNPNKSVNDYIKLFKTFNNKNVHIDPLLAYYMQYGFKIVCVKENYFPYESAHNYGVIIKYKNPVWFLGPIMKLIPSNIFNKVMKKIASYYKT